MAAVVANSDTRRGRGPRVGVALSPTALCAAIQRPGESRTHAWRISIVPFGGNGGAWTGLTDALRALARDAGVSDGRLTVALMPPLAEARDVDLPPVSEAEALQLLARGAAKYFVGARGPQVVGAVHGGRADDEGATTTVAVAASSRLLNAIHDAVAAAGWTLEAVVPAEAAWGVAAVRWTARRKGRAQLLIAHADRTDLLRIEDARLVGLRRFRVGTTDAALIAEASANGAGPISVVGTPDARRDLTRQLAASGVTVDTPAGVVAEVAENPDLLAAAFAGPDASPKLITESARARAAMRVRGVATRIAIAAGVFILVGAGSELLGVKRELRSIRTQEAAIKSQLVATMVGTSTVQATFNQLTALARADRTAPRWSAVIAAISDHLPPEAYVTAIRASVDSVQIDGKAKHARAAFDALAHTPLLIGSRGTAAKRVATTDGPPLEEFHVGARLAPRVAPAPAPAAKPAAKGTAK
jgi:hypothetical protein